MTLRHGLAWALSCVLGSLAAPAAAQEPPLTLEQALAAARSTNPTLAAARRRRAIDTAGIGVARERPNPEVLLEKAKETPHEAATVSQLLELSGSRSRRIAVAEATARIGEAEIAQTEAEITIEVERAFFGLAAAQRKLAVTREIQELAARARAAAAARLEVGDVSRLDVLQTEVAFFQAENETTGQAGEVQASRIALNALIGRDPAAPTEVTEGPDALAFPDAAVASSALSANTALLVLDRQAAEARARAALARAQQVPDPTVEGTVTHGAEPEFTWGWRAAVTIPFPVFARHRAAVRVEEATLASLQAQRAALAARIRAAVASALARASALRVQYARYRDEILPKSREVESMAQESYRAGQTNLQALLQSLQAARELRARSLQAASDLESALVDLEQALRIAPR